MLTSKTTSAPRLATMCRWISPASRQASRYFCAIAARLSADSPIGWAMPGIVTGAASSGCLATKAATSPTPAGLPMLSATSIVKKSLDARNRSTVSSRIWSASTNQGCGHFLFATAAAAASRTLAGSLPMKLCSRFDLFQTGATTTPAAASRSNAANWASASWANRSPTPNEKRGRVFMAVAYVARPGSRMMILDRRMAILDPYGNALPSAIPSPTTAAHAAPRIRFPSGRVGQPLFPRPAARSRLPAHCCLRR